MLLNLLSDPMRRSGLPWNLSASFKKPWACSVIPGLHVGFSL